ncbi:hypothetical protein [Mitsuaria sp. 7]|uniref:hypothetical protein n=1 Tax=Mitsuaria sp. 7 TaxID=1658665 RepID=UPI0007DD343F|nr:hypothetical protein [Mitsuaria sp. 7]ANH66836.1 hypothetical protein ABE85_03315 [Mitsuaria sp. 7]
MSWTNAFAGAVVALGLGVSAAAQACSCIRPDAATIFREADSIVIARVKAVHYQPAWIGEARVVGDIEVLDTLKTTTGTPITRIWTEPETPACGLPLQAGLVYLLVPTGVDGDQVDHCWSWALGSGDKQRAAVTKALFARRNERERARALRGKAIAGAVAASGGASR